MDLKKIKKEAIEERENGVQILKLKRKERTWRERGGGEREGGWG